MLAWHQVPRRDLQGLQLVQATPSQSGSRHTVWYRIRVALKTANHHRGRQPRGEAVAEADAATTGPEPGSARSGRQPFILLQPHVAHPPRQAPRQRKPLTRGDFLAASPIIRRALFAALVVHQPAAVRWGPHAGGLGAPSSGRPPWPSLTLPPPCGRSRARQPTGQVRRYRGEPGIPWAEHHRTSANGNASLYNNNWAERPAQRTGTPVPVWVNPPSPLNRSAPQPAPRSGWPCSWGWRWRSGPLWQPLVRGARCGRAAHPGR